MINKALPLGVLFPLEDVPAVASNPISTGKVVKRLGSHPLPARICIQSIKGVLAVLQVAVQSLLSLNGA